MRYIVSYLLSYNYHTLYDLPNLHWLYTVPSLHDTDFTVSLHRLHVLFTIYTNFARLEECSKISAETDVVY